MELEDSHLQYIVEHVFLPPKLPQKYDSNTHHKDATLLKYMAEACRKFLDVVKTSPHNPSGRDIQSWHHLHKMLRNMSRLHTPHQLVREDIEDSFKNMKVGDVLPIYVVAQNAGVIFRKPSVHHMTFEGFRLSLPAELVTGTVGKILQRFPTNPLLPFAALPAIYGPLANMLAYLSGATMDDAVPKTKKGGDYHHEIRDVNSPRYITEALAGVIRANDPSNPPVVTTPYVEKRINDHVLWKSALKPWRRSASWLLVRVALQTSILDKKIDEAHGYKSFIAFFMGMILDDVLEADPQRFTLDLLHTMNAKLARRLEKMGGNMENNAIAPLQSIYDTVYRTATILSIRWGELQNISDETIQWVPDNRRADKNSFCMSFLHSQHYLREVVNRSKTLQGISSGYNNAATIATLKSSCINRLSSSKANLPTNFAIKEVEIALYDFESWIEVQLPIWSKTASMLHCKPLHSLIKEYRQIATAHYRDNPEGTSLMHLCVIELWVALDKIVTNWCPLLMEYSPEIPEDFLDPLLLPHIRQMERLHKAQSYLRNRHRLAAEHGSPSILGNCNSAQSFANRYFDSPLAESLKALRNRIRQWANSQQATLRAELATKNAEYISLMGQARSMSCNKSKIVHQNGFTTYKHKAKKCDKCRLEKRARGIIVQPFEEPLPENIHLSQPVIFELECPVPFATWRDATHDILLSVQDSERKSNKELYALENYWPLSTFYSPSFPGHHIGLASSAKSIKDSHHGTAHTMPTTEKDIFVGHAGHFSLFDRTGECWISHHPSSGNLRSTCAFKVEGGYSSLQEYVNDTSHAPNFASASLQTCPSELSLAEFTAYLLMRSGNRVQWWNIMRALRTQILNFAEPAVVALVLQCIWQAGPLGDGGLYRDAHFDLQDQGFGIHVTEELHMNIQSLGSNWKQFLHLYMITRLAQKLLDFTPYPDVQGKARHVLLDSRSLARSWITGLLESTSLRPKDEVMDAAHIRQSLAVLGLVFRSTFDTPSETFEDQKDASWFIYAGVLSASASSFLPISLQPLSWRDRRMALFHEIKLTCRLRAVPSILHNAMVLAWKGYSHGGNWESLSIPAHRWWTTSTKRDDGYSPRIVHINILDGTLLIDGKMCDRLPTQYSSHPLYKKILGDTVFLEARPSTMNGMSYEVYYLQSEIHLDLSDDKLLIRRRHELDVQEYIPVQELEKDIPDLLATAHHFWYDEKSNSIEIRPDRDIWNPSRSNWVAYLEDIGGSLCGPLVKASQALLDPNSSLYQALSQALQPLEPSSRGLLITRIRDDPAGPSSIYIARHDLNFQLQCDGQISCHLLPNYIVSEMHNGMGCLVGLRSVLCLRPRDNRDNALKIIVPKGSFSIHEGAYGHPTLIINAEDNKGYFLYEVDTVIGRLVGNRTMESDLYLIKLHAFTSSPLPDILTQRSGTNEALSRLENASCLSGLGLSPESRSYLDEIAGLTPLRAFYPNHLRVMQTVNWNDILPSTSQHILFRQRVTLNLDHWREVAVFQGNEELASRLEVPKGMHHLETRESYRSITYRGKVLDLVHAGEDSLESNQSQAREQRSFRGATLFMKHCGAGMTTPQSFQDSVMKWETVDGAEEWKWGDVHYWLSAPSVPHISHLWCTLYNLCQKMRWPPSFEVGMVMGFLAFGGVPVEFIANLASIIHDHTFKSAKYTLPRFTSLDLTQGTTFDRSQISNLLNDCQRGFQACPQYHPPGGTASMEESDTILAQARYTTALELEIKDTLDNLQLMWPRIPSQLDLTPRPLLDLSSSSPKLNEARELMMAWSRNRAFQDHVTLVQSRLRVKFKAEIPFTLYQPIRPPPRLIPERLGGVRLDILMHQRPINPLQQIADDPISKPIHDQAMIAAEISDPAFVKLIDQLKGQIRHPFQDRYITHLKSSIEAFELTRVQYASTNSSDNWIDLKSIRTTRRNHAIACMQNIKRALSPHSSASKLLQMTGLWADITPTTLLQCLSFKNRAHLSSTWMSHLIQYAIAIHDLKRIDRMLQLDSDGKFNHLEIEASYHRVWDPAGYPDWLLFEIDAQVSIRPAQATMALDMILSNLSNNTVRQLNMGEGKSSVIVPVVASAYGGTGQVLSRVIVPRAQTKQQFHFLRRSLTSLSDRPIFYLPINRQSMIDAESARRTLDFLKRMANSGGIWLCEPEQLLSLKLLGLDKIMRSAEGGEELVSLHSWLEHNTRDILDESDEVLSTLQQVIYTVGHQRNLDAAPRRWEVVQKLLELLAVYLIKHPANHLSSGFIVENSVHIAGFPRIRIHSEAGRQSLKQFIKESLEAGGWPIPRSLAQFAVDFIISQSPLKESMDAIATFSDEDPYIMDTLLILRGFIGSDILLHGLKDKRWRVQYGLDLKRTKLAIPYRAKDFPSLRSEFGHPDVTILLTCLSYYYSGLSDDMIRQTLKQLLRSATPDLTYTEWLKPCRKKVPLELLTIRGLNVDDGRLMDANLFPFLRHNKAVINFYLNAFVFPRQAKEFQSKLSSSGWDLAAKKENTTSSFSGTNDGRFLLPSSIHQIDHPAHLHTNAKVISHLLLAENQTVVQYSNHAKSTDLLNIIRHIPSRPRVILDVGAQILDSSNLEFSRRWLFEYEEESTTRAVVFFDEAGDLLVLNREGSTLPFLDSPYANNLEHCLVYLDDAHTRGTDLHIPPCQAAVTLGPKLTKDKLVQGCMRMRQLGNGHTLVFLASEEIAGLVGLSTGCELTGITSFEVVIWAIRETWRQLQANLPAWVQQGKSFLKRQTAWRQLAGGRMTGQNIRSRFCETETRTLLELYGPNSERKRTLIDGIDAKSDLGKLIVDRCQDFDQNSPQDAGLYEEMEIELVHEKEVEREVERHPSANPTTHYIHPHVVKFVETGHIPPDSSAFRSFRRALAKTSLLIARGGDAVFSNLLVTNDFYHTIELRENSVLGTMDHFLRPVDWVVTPNYSTVPYVIAFSPFEVNHLLPLFRKSNAVKLHLFAPRGNMAMRTLEDLDRFVLPSHPAAAPLPRQIAIQLNLFSGSLYIRDHATYEDMCKTLRLYYAELPPHLQNPNTMNSSCFVKDESARIELGLIGTGFENNPLPFLRKLFTFRRHGQSLGPSHMGKLLYGSRLHKGIDGDFIEGEECLPDT